MVTQFCSCIRAVQTLIPCFVDRQLSWIEYLTTNQGVGGSNPPRSATKTPYVFVNNRNTSGSIFLSPNLPPKNVNKPSRAQQGHSGCTSKTSSSQVAKILHSTFLQKVFNFFCSISMKDRRFCPKTYFPFPIILLILCYVGTQ